MNIMLSKLPNLKYLEYTEETGRFRCWVESPPMRRTIATTTFGNPVRLYNLPFPYYQFFLRFRKTKNIDSSYQLMDLETFMTPHSITKNGKLGMCPLPNKRRNKICLGIGNDFFEEPELLINSVINHYWQSIFTTVFAPSFFCDDKYINDYEKWSKLNLTQMDEMSISNITVKRKLNTLKFAPKILYSVLC